MTTTDADSWYASLNHGGLLIAPSRVLQFFPEAPSPLSAHAEEKLRRALTRLESENGDASTLVLDTVLEDVIGLGQRFQTDSGSWLKGNAVPPEWTRPAVTGELVKPRRVWQAANGAVLPVFVDAEARIGIGRGRRAFARVVEWLRRTEHRLALLTNARQWRIVYAGLDYDAFAEADTTLWFQEGEAGAQVVALRTLLGPESLIPKEKGRLPRLLDSIETSRKGQAELSADLGERVRQAVELLIQTHAPAVAKATELNVSPREIYLAATRIVMRMVVVLFAEARNLLPQENAIYHDSYGLQGLREALDRVGGGAASSFSGERLRHRYGAWARVLALFRLVYDGSPHESLPVLEYGGGLFEPGSKDSTDLVLRALTFFEDPETAPDDGSVHRILTLLTKSRIKVRQGKAWTFVTTPVDFSDLSSEYIGILYEGLLNYELRRVGENDAVVFLALGDEPALPLSRLEAMEDRAVAALVEKARKGSKLAASEDEESSEEDEEESEEEDLESEASGPKEEDEATPETAESEEGTADDERQKVRDRARVWAERAVVEGKLVSKPKGKGAEAKNAYKQSVERAAKGLVSRTVLPGEWFLVRFGGTRKGTGTFYTKPQLAVPTVHRTLRPLAYDPPKDPEGNPNEDAPSAEWTPKKPEDILALKVCDPACGSGSFLVASLRFLTEALLESLHYHKRIQEQGEKTLVTLAEGKPSTGALTEELLPCRPNAPDFDSRLRAQLKRWVVELCLYGVDIDSLAVELCRLALWVETMDRNLPFSFLDHKVKCGNSLVGCWFDRFRDYPALAWEREGGDKNHTKGVHFEKEAWTKAIKDFRKRLRPALADWIVGQGRLFEKVEGKTPDEIHDEALRLFEEMHALPIQETPERTVFYREKIEGSEPLTKLKEAFDTWCAIWFWPAERLQSAPMPKDLGEPREEARRNVRDLADEHRFFHWELEFPDVFRAKESGFDAVVGNPPWEIQKPNSKEFFSNVDPLYRSYGKQEALAKQEEYFRGTEDAESSWLIYNARFKALSNWNKHVGSPFGDGGNDGATFALGKKSDSAHELWTSRRQAYKTYSDPAHPFRWQGSADINTYKMFLEVGYALARQGGQLGLLIPSGIYTDKGTSALRHLLLNQCEWRYLYAFQNERFVFAAIHHSFKVATLWFRKGGSTSVLRTRFRLGPGDSPEVNELESDIPASGRFLPISTGGIERFSPKTRAILEIRHPRDLEVLEKIYENSVLLGDQSENGWKIQYAREFDMTNDSMLFPPRPKWEAKGYKPDVYGRWIGQDGDIALPLYQGVMINQYDFSQKGWVMGTGLQANWQELSWDGKTILPQFLIGSTEYAENKRSIKSPAKIAFRDIARSTDERTFIGALIPNAPCGNVLGVLGSERELWPILACLNSFVLDWTLRQRIGGTHLNLYVIEELPVIPPERLVSNSVITEYVGELSFVTSHFVVAWMTLNLRTGTRKRRWALTEHARLRLRCVLDAIIAELYGLEFEDLLWILRDCDHPTESYSVDISRTFEPKGFWRVDREKDPELRHTVLTLAAFRDLKEVIARHGGERRAGIEAFCTMNDGDGWQVPESLCLADLDLGHDDRAKQPQPVRSRLGPRWTDLQLQQSPEEFWSECRYHARHLLGHESFEQLIRALQKQPEYPLPAEAAMAAEARPSFAGQLPASSSTESPHDPEAQGSLFPNQQQQPNKRTDPPKLA